MKYKCQICGYIYDEEKEGSPISMLEKCPLCQQPASNFKPLEEETCSSDTALSEKNETELSAQPKPAPGYDPELVRHDPSARYMEEIHEMAVNGESLHAAMGTLLPLPKWEDILLLGAQLNPAVQFPGTQYPARRFPAQFSHITEISSTASIFSGSGHSFLWSRA